MKKPILNHALIMLALCFVSFSAVSQVVEVGEHGFVISVERTVPTSHERAYQQFIQVKNWWSSEHTYFGDSNNLTIDAKAGGCFCEINGTKQVLHMTVSYVDPNNEIRMVGGLGPLQMMGVQGGMVWKFEKIDEKTTKIVHRYQVVGFVAGGLAKIADAVNQVQTLQVDRLVKQINSEN